LNEIKKERKKKVLKDFLGFRALSEDEGEKGS
jgi:hypothetical protein